MANPLEWENKNALLIQGSVSVASKVKTAPGGVPKWIRDATLGDSDKSFTVPEGKIWDIRAIYVKYGSSATAGNRLLKVRFDLDTDTLFENNAFAVQPESTVYKYLLHPSVVVDVSTPNQCQPIPPALLTAGMKIRVYDGSVIDAAADDIDVTLHVIEYDA